MRNKTGKLILKCALVAGMVLPQVVSANCYDALRALALSKRVGTNNYAIGEVAKKHRETKDPVFEQEINAFGTAETILAKKNSEYSKKTRQVIEENKLPERFRDILKTIYFGINNPVEVISWMKDLYTSTLHELYARNNPAEIEAFKSDKKIPEDVLKTVLQRRLKRAGFEGSEEKIAFLSKAVSSEEFGQVLKNRKLIIDVAFKGRTHGHFIHMLQIDFMAHLARKGGLDSKLVSDFYEYMGTDAQIDLSNGQSFKALEDGWFGLFDSFESDLSQPERLNPILEKYLGLKY